MADGLWLMAYGPMGLTIWFSGSSGLTGDSGGKREKEERGSEKGGEREENHEERGSEKGGERERKRRKEGERERDYSRTFRTSRKTNSPTT